MSFKYLSEPLKIGWGGGAPSGFSFYGTQRGSGGPVFDCRYGVLLLMAEIFNHAFKILQSTLAISQTHVGQYVMVHCQQPIRQGGMTHEQFQIPLSTNFQVYLRKKTCREIIYFGLIRALQLAAGVADSHLT